MSISCPFIITPHTVVVLEGMGGLAAAAQYDASLLMIDNKDDA